MLLPLLWVRCERSCASADWRPTNTSNRSMAERTGDLPNLIAIAQGAAATAAKTRHDGHGQEGPLQ